MVGASPDQTAEVDGVTNIGSLHGIGVAKKGASSGTEPPGPSRRTPRLGNQPLLYYEILHLPKLKAPSPCRIFKKNHHSR
jgi:hypothetical protein